jgi:hypothetical protein
VADTERYGAEELVSLLLSRLNEEDILEKEHV